MKSCSLCQKSHRTVAAFARCIEARWQPKRGPYDEIVNCPVAVPTPCQAGIEGDGIRFEAVNFDVYDLVTSKSEFWAVLQKRKCAKYSRRGWKRVNKSYYLVRFNPLHTDIDLAARSARYYEISSARVARQGVRHTLKYLRKLKVHERDQRLRRAIELKLKRAQAKLIAPELGATVRHEQLLLPSGERISVPLGQGGG